MRVQPAGSSYGRVSTVSMTNRALPHPTPEHERPEEQLIAVSRPSDQGIRKAVVTLDPLEDLKSPLPFIQLRGASESPFQEVR